MELSSIVTTLVDTGSTFDLLKYDFAKKNIQDFETRFSEVTMAPLTLGDGSKALQPCGIVENVSLRFEKSLGKYATTSTTFVVIRGLPDDVIIGHNFFLFSPVERGTPSQCRDFVRETEHTPRAHPYSLGVL
jgi:hypothetical protein